MNATNDDNLDVDFDLEITKRTRRHSGAGTWVSGILRGHRFEALVFPEHAENQDYEIGGANDETTQAIVHFLAGGLADHIYR